MGVIFLIPGLISLILVIRGRLETAFLYVYLPALILIPYGFAFRLPHLPAISAAQWALLPIAWVALTRQVRKGQPCLMDLLMILFLISTGVSEVLRERVMNDGIFLVIDNFISIFLSYVVGRSIIEPGLRLATVRQFVLVMLLLAPVSLMDWRMGQNIYGIVGERVFDTYQVMANIQLRGGHGRVAASFNDSELAGIVFAMTVTLDAWLFFIYKSQSRANLGQRFTILEKYHIPLVLLVMFLLMTQSRGPLGALIAGVLILQIRKFRNVKLGTCVVAVALAVGTYGALLYLSRYTAVSDPNAVVDEQQGSALYRVRMNELYQPIVAQGGLLGWGRLGYPAVPSMVSIDNEYLRVHLAYGTLGYVLFIIIALESIRSLLARAWKFQGPEDRAMAISLLAALAVFWIAISTVYMGEQIPQIAFLLLGWGQSLTTGSMQLTSDSAEESTQPRFALGRVFS